MFLSFELNYNNLDRGLQSRQDFFRFNSRDTLLRAATLFATAALHHDCYVYVYLTCAANSIPLDNEGITDLTKGFVRS